MTRTLRSSSVRADEPGARPLRGAVVMGSLVAVALVLLTWVVLGANGGEDLVTAASETDQGTTTLAQAEGEEDATGDAAPETTPDEEATLDEVPMVTYEVYLARDPFEPVVPADMPEPPTSPTDPDTGDPDPGDPADPGEPDPADPGEPDPADPDDPTVDPSPDEEECVGDDEVVCDGTVLKLLDIVTENGERRAVIQVDEIIYEVREGERFHERFQLLSIGDDEVTALNGDESFDLPLDQQTMK